MSLDAADCKVIWDLVKKEKHFNDWVEHPASYLVHHDKECCEEARLWFLAYARSMEIGSLSEFNVKAPTWLSDLFVWGPSEWPISWCQVVKEEVVDCGVFAVLAREVFKAQGLQAHPAQALLSYNKSCTSHWKGRWDSKKKSEGDVFPWIGDKIVYHELCVLESQNGEARIYDSTWGNWYEPQGRVGYGAILAIRTECPRILQWGRQSISCGEWTSL